MRRSIPIERVYVSPGRVVWSSTSGMRQSFHIKLVMEQFLIVSRHCDFPIQMHGGSEECTNLRSHAAVV